MNDNSIRCMECQLGTSVYVPCFKPATCIVYWPSGEECPQCDFCADHSVRNRNAKRKPIPANYKQPTIGDNNPPAPIPSARDEAGQHVVDQFGHIKAQIADLEQQEKVLRAQILELGQKEVEGDLFRAVVSTSSRDGRDAAFKAKIEELIEAHLSPQYIRAHTTSTEITTVRVSARKGVKLQVVGD